jgi:hypothetical protein
LNDANEVLGQISELATANLKTAAVLGARAMVLSKLLEAVVPHLTTLQRAGVTPSFRGIEEAMSMMDDVPLPAEYQSTLLEPSSLQ